MGNPLEFFWRGYLLEGYSGGNTLDGVIWRWSPGVGLIMGSRGLIIVEQVPRDGSLGGPPRRWSHGRVQWKAK